MPEPQGPGPTPHVSRQVVADGQRWDVFVEPHEDTDGRATVTYVFRTHDPRPGRPAQERRASGHSDALAAMSESALQQRFYEAE